MESITRSTELRRPLARGSFLRFCLACKPLPSLVRFIISVVNSISPTSTGIRMARSKNGVNKSQEIRNALKENPKAKSKEIVAALGAKGIKVAPSLVYMVKSQMRRKKQRQKREMAATASKALGIANPVDLIIRVKELAGEAGGISKLKQLVDVLAE